jgi:pimeloyl-ACP methyl ester carboxylesterase
MTDKNMRDVAGVQLEMTTKGKGPALLYLHGMDGVEGSAPLIDLLAEKFTVYAPSHPGFGGSSLPANFSSVDDLGYFYLDLLDLLNLKDVTVAGFSFGGWVAAEMLVKDCSRVSRLILGAPLGLPTGDRKKRIVTDFFMLPARDAQQLMQNKPIEQSTPTEAELERTLRNAETVSIYGWSPYLNNPKLRQRLHRIKVPAHVLWGADDKLAPASSYGANYAKALNNASFETIPQCGHKIYIDQPEAAAKAIVSFTQSAAVAA